MANGKSTDSRAVQIVRYSPRPSDDDVKSLDVQMDRNAAYASMAGLTIVETFKDPDTSARRIPLDEREGGAAMLSYVAQHGIRHIIVQKLDRLFRNAEDGLGWLRKWKEAGRSLHLSDQGGISMNTGTATGKLVMTFLLGVAEFEPNQTAERTSGAMIHSQKQGKKISSKPPYGYMADPDDPDGRIVPCETEQQVLARMVKLSDANISAYHIASHLKEYRVPCRNGTCNWKGNVVAKILARLDRDATATR